LKGLDGIVKFWVEEFVGIYMVVEFVGVIKFVELVELLGVSIDVFVGEIVLIGGVEFVVEVLLKVLVFEVVVAGVVGRPILFPLPVELSIPV
jgi:hypothetical protein